MVVIVASVAVTLVVTTNVVREVAELAAVAEVENGAPGWTVTVVTTTLSVTVMVLIRPLWLLLAVDEPLEGGVDRFAAGAGLDAPVPIRCVTSTMNMFLSCSWIAAKLRLVSLTT